MGVGSGLGVGEGWWIAVDRGDASEPPIGVVNRSPRMVVLWCFDWLLGAGWMYMSDGGMRIRERGDGSDPPIGVVDHSVSVVLFL